MESGGNTVYTTLPVDLIDAPDLTVTLQRCKKRIVGHGSFGTVFRCSGAQNGEVAVKAITSHYGSDVTQRAVSTRKVRRERGISRRLDHPNIVPFLGMACGDDFGSDYPCMVLMWMPHGTLTEYLRHHGTTLSLPSRARLINGSVAGLEYLHSKRVVHGDFHPGNILIDGEHNARLTDFGFSQTLSRHDQLTYLWTDSIRPGAVMFAAPELQYPDLYPDVKMEATLNSDIYSLGSIILFTLSGKYPWPNRTEVECKLKEFENPPRPAWPDGIPDGVWNFIERCWSPRRPTNRPSAQEALIFSRDSLEQLLLPKCGKSSIADHLAKEPVAQVSADMETRIKQPQISIGERRIRLSATMGFRLAHGGGFSPFSPYEQAHAVLRSLPTGVNFILLCASKGGIFASLGSLYCLIDGFFGGRPQTTLVVTDLDTLDERWWERNQDSITEPVQSIPRVCVTFQIGRDQSKQALKALLRTYATSPISPRVDLSSPRVDGSWTELCLEITRILETREKKMFVLRNRCGLTNYPRLHEAVANVQALYSIA